MDRVSGTQSEVLEKWMEKAKKKKEKGISLQFALRHAVQLATWATPTKRDHKDTGDLQNSMTRMDGKERNDTVPRQAFGVMQPGSPAETEKPGQLNPAFSRWLMGLPEEWDAFAPTVTQLSARKRKRS